jgi:hypothetical protein
MRREICRNHRKPQHGQGINTWCYEAGDLEEKQQRTEETMHPPVIGHAVHEGDNGPVIPWNRGLGGCGDLWRIGTFEYFTIKPTSLGKGRGLGQNEEPTLKPNMLGCHLKDRKSSSGGTPRSIKLRLELTYIYGGKCQNVSSGLSGFGGVIYLQIGEPKLLLRARVGR